MNTLVIVLGLVIGLTGVVAVLVGVSLMLEQYFAGEIRVLRYKIYFRYVENCTMTGQMAVLPAEFWK